MASTETVVLVVTAGVLVIGVASSFARRIGVAAPLVLVVIGVGLGAIPGAAEATTVPPELILTVVLPPLLFAAARQVPIVDFRRSLRVILLLAVVLVVLSALAVGSVVHLLWAAVPLALAVALGAVVGPPDAVAATAIGKRIGLPPRIVTILEGEGLINDATALVLLATALDIAEAKSAGALSGWSVTGSFAWSIVGGSVIGWIIGRVSVAIRQRLTDATLDASISIAVPFLAYLAGAFAGSSGIVAVVAAGIVVGNAGVFRIPAAPRYAEDATWTLVSRVLENAVFLYMGLQLWPIVGGVLDGRESLPRVLGLSAIVVLVLVGIRFLAMPPLIWSIRIRVRRAGVRHEADEERMRRGEARFGESPEPRVRRRLDRFRRMLERSGNDLTAARDELLGWRDGVILGVAGMRGVVTVAAAQTLPMNAQRPGLILIAYVVAIVTLLGQGLLLTPIARRLRPRPDSDVESRRETAELRRTVQDAGDAEVRRQLDERTDVPQRVRDELRANADLRTRQWEAWGQTDPSDPASPVVVFQQIRREELKAERLALREERRRGRFSSEAVSFVGAALDSVELQMNAYWDDDRD